MVKWLLIISLCTLVMSANAQTDSIPNTDTLLTKAAADSIILQKKDSTASKSTKTASIVEQNVQPVDTLVADSTKQKRPFVRDFGIYVDYGKLTGLLVDYEEKYEAGARLIFGNNIFIGIEAGMATIHPQMAYKNANYEVEGNYMRLGAGRLSALNPKTNIGLGLFYGISNFSDRGTPKLSSPSGLHDDTANTFERTNLTATWYEFNFISESTIRKNIYAGLNIRLRVMGNYDAQSPLDVYTIPGYGRTFDKSLPAANLFLRLKIF